MYNLVCCPCSVSSKYGCDTNSLQYSMSVPRTRFTISSRFEVKSLYESESSLVRESRRLTRFPPGGVEGARPRTPGNSSARLPPAQLTPLSVSRTGGFWEMKTTGLILTLIGIVWLLIALNMDTTVETGGQRVGSGLYSVEDAGSQPWPHGRT
jgi:hypothetical protein